MKPLLLLFALLAVTGLHGQPSVKVEVSSDTVRIGQMVQVTYTIENGEGTFQIPDMSALPVISGPNSSSSFVYQNGKMSSSQSYSFTLRPMEEGYLLVPGTTYTVQGTELTIQPVEITVVDQGDFPARPKSEPATIKSTREKKKF